MDVRDRGRAHNKVVEKIRKGGPLGFDSFMEIALYSEQGFYSNSQPFGHAGDYFTSPTIHPIFGAMVAVQLWKIWKLLGKPIPFTVVESGSGNGLLARDIIGCLEEFSEEIASSLNYVAVDRIPISEPIEEITSIVSTRLPQLSKVDVVLSNELLDAFPVKLIEIRCGRPYEILVGLGPNEALIEITNNESLEDHEFFRFDLNLRDLEGYRGPIPMHMADWCQSVSDTLDRGFVLTIDYGFERSQYYSMARSNRLLQTYFQHVDGLNPLDKVGDQDITSHVDFTTFREMSAANGLKDVCSLSQREWLTNLHFTEIINANRERGHISRRCLSLINNLVDPDGLGAFRVEIQSKGIGEVACEDLFTDLRCVENEWPIAPVTSRHMANELQKN